MTTFTEMVFQIAVNISGGDFLIPIILLTIGLVTLLIALRFPIGAAYFTFLGLTYGLVMYFNVHESIFSVYVILLILGGFGLGLLVWNLFSRIR